MSVKLTTAREAARDNGIKILTYGVAGSGKTRLCATTGAPTVIISAEAGLLSLKDHDIAVIEVSSMADLKQAYSYLASDEGRKFEWVCLDSLSEIAEVVLATEKEATRDPRKAYGELADQMTALIRGFRDLPGRNVYMSAKCERVKDELSGAMLYQPMMPGNKVGQQLPYFFDLVFALRVEKDAEGNLTRWLQTAGDQQYVAKDRSGCLDAFEEPSLAKIAAKIHSHQE